MKNMILGVTGSVAATLTPKIVEAFEVAGYDVNIVATTASLYFWDKEAVNVTVWTEKEEWPDNKYSKHQPIPHIDLRDWADVLVIAPLTANTLAKLAHGFCDNLLTCLVRAWERKNPIIIAPAMNTLMWENPATAKHIKLLKKLYNVTVVNPVSKKLACGDTGIGALAPIESIVNAVFQTK